MFDGITNKGSEYLAKCQATGEGIKLVKVKIGDGRLLDSEDPTTFTDIKSLKKEVEVSEKTQIESNLRLVIEFNNEGVTTGYFPREIGIYALDGETEILYWYINDGDQTTWMPPAEKAPVKYKYGVNIMATNNETTLVNWTGKELWVDKEFLNKELEKKQDVNDNRLLTTVKTIWGAINELFNNKLEKGGYTGTAQNLLTEIAKKASKTTLGRIIVGNGLNVDSDGRISVAAHTHGANEVIEDSSHRMVTDAEKAAWNGKLNQGTVPNSLNSAEKIVAALQGSGGLKFDPNVLHIGDAGTKRVGYYYLDKLKDGIFECLEETTTTINDSSKFRDISNKASADRLDNLIKNKKLYYIQETINIDFDNYDSNIFIVSCVIENRSTSFTYLPFSFVFLKNNDYSMREIGHINNVTRGVSLTISNNIATITGDSTTAKLMSVVILAL